MSFKILPFAFQIQPAHHYVMDAAVVPYVAVSYQWKATLGDIMAGG